MQELPGNTWVMHCTGKNNFMVGKAVDTEEWIVLNCKEEKGECWGCYPRGTLPFNPNTTTLKEIAHMDAHDVGWDELDPGYHLPTNKMANFLKQYEGPNRYFIYALSCDIWTLFILEAVPLEPSLNAEPEVT